MWQSVPFFIYINVCVLCFALVQMAYILLFVIQFDSPTHLVPSQSTMWLWYVAANLCITCYRCLSNSVNVECVYCFLGFFFMLSCAGSKCTCHVSDVRDISIRTWYVIIMLFRTYFQLHLCGRLRKTTANSQWKIDCGISNTIIHMTKQFVRQSQINKPKVFDDDFINSWQFTHQQPISILPTLPTAMAITPSILIWYMKPTDPF